MAPARLDKNKAVVDYLLSCEAIYDSTLYFNFANLKEAVTQFITLASDKSVNEPYIDGSVKKRYSLTVQSILSITDNPVVKVAGYDNENISDMSEIQTLIDWIAEQNKLRNYPDFGEDCEIEEIRTTTNNPRLDLINTQVTPPLAQYSFTIEIDYIDYSEKIWNN